MILVSLFLWTIIHFSPRTAGENNGVIMAYSDLFLHPRADLRVARAIKGLYIDIVSKIRSTAEKYDIDANLFIRVAKCESGFKLDIHNTQSTASGIFQFLDSTFSSQSKKYGIEGEKDSEVQIELAAMMIRDGGITHWKASQSCWNMLGTGSLLADKL